jgi:hypothetical protein
MTTVSVLTVVSAIVEATQEEHLAAAYQAALDGEAPDGLLASALLRGPDHQWQIATLWRDHAALAAMRARPEPPTAPRVFREVGAEPALTVFEVINGRHGPCAS